MGGVREGTLAEQRPAMDPDFGFDSAPCWSGLRLWNPCHSGLRIWLVSPEHRKNHYVAEFPGSACITPTTIFGEPFDLGRYCRIFRGIPAFARARNGFDMQRRSRGQSTSPRLCNLLDPDGKDSTRLVQQCCRLAYVYALPCRSCSRPTAAFSSTSRTDNSRPSPVLPCLLAARDKRELHFRHFSAPPKLGAIEQMVHLFQSSQSLFNICPPPGSESSATDSPQDSAVINHALPRDCIIAGGPASSPSPISPKKVRAVEIATQCTLFLGYCS